VSTENLTLPLLPLKSGVVLPGMVFTLGLETDEAKAAAEAAGRAGGRLLIVPFIDGRYAKVGVVSEVMEQGDLPGGLPAIVVRGDRRATIGTGVPGTGDALWVEADVLEEATASPAVAELAREYRAVLENILLSRGAGRVAAQLREVTEPGRLADVAGYSPDLSVEQKVQVLETLDVEDRLRLVLGWARDTLADLALRERIKTDVEEGMEKTQREFLLRRQLEAIRKELEKLTHEEVTTRILHAGIGAITESDVQLALTSPEDTLVIGFNVTADDAALKLAEGRDISLREYQIIYNLVDDVKAQLEGRLKPIEEVVHLGRAVVRQTFKHGKVGTIAGCYVTSGVLERSARVRVIRGGVVVFPPADKVVGLDSLKRFKDDAKEVREGFECGLKITDFNDVKVDDVIEAFKIESRARTL